MTRWTGRATLALAWLFAACGGEAGPSGDGFALESSHAVTQTIGAEGGSLTTTDAGGRSYTLVIPPLALAGAVAITLTPVASFPTLSGGAEVLAGANFAPEGLAFARPATLRILDPQLTGRLKGFTYAGHGEAVQPAIAGSDADEFVALVTHFSGVGLIAETLELEPDGPTPGEVQAFTEVNSIATTTDWPAGNWDSAYESIVQGLDRWYRDHIGPALAGAHTDQELTNALGGYSAWLHVIDCGASSCTSDVGNLHLWPEGIGALIRQSLAATLADAAAATREAVERSIERTIQLCRANRDLGAGAQSVYWTKVAVVLGAESSDDPLGECVTLQLYELSFPDPIAEGTTAELRLVAGLSFGGAPSTYEQYLEVHIEASDALPSVAGGNTAVGTGEFTMDFTPDGDAPVVLGIRVNWGQNGLQDILKVDTLVERSLGISVSLTPTAAILDPGTEAVFTATVMGTSNSAVAWSATGGSHTVSGNTLTFLAGSTPGTYAVTATSVADPNRTAVATVEIVRPAPRAVSAVRNLSHWEAVVVSPDGARNLVSENADAGNLGTFTADLIATHVSNYGTGTLVVHDTTEVVLHETTGDLVAFAMRGNVESQIPAPLRGGRIGSGALAISVDDAEGVEYRFTYLACIAGGEYRIEATIWEVRYLDAEDVLAQSRRAAPSCTGESVVTGTLPQGDYTIDFYVTLSSTTTPPSGSYSAKLEFLP